MDESAVAKWLKRPCQETREALNLHIVYKHFRPIEGVDIKGAVGESFHYRRGRTKWEPALRSGRTQCFIYDEEHRLAAWGETLCRSDESFCYREGRDWARDFALKELARKARERMKENG